MPRTVNSTVTHRRPCRTVVAGRLVDCPHLAVRERGGIKARRIEGILIEPEANHVFGLHDYVSLRDPAEVGIRHRGGGLIECMQILDS